MKTRRQLAREVRDLNSRVEGMETLMAELVQTGRIEITLPPSDADVLCARQVEREIQRPSPAWGRS